MTPTTQETQIYTALGTGDHDQIAELHDAAYAADQTPPDPLPDDWLSPAEQYEQDYLNAWAHYQDDHEPPQNTRETNTRGHASAENEHAGGPHNMALFGLEPPTAATGITVHAIGSHFVGGARVYLDNTQIDNKDQNVVSTTEITFKVPTKPAGTYGVYVRVGQSGFQTISLPLVKT